MIQSSRLTERTFLHWNMSEKYQFLLTKNIMKIYFTKDPDVTLNWRRNKYWPIHLLKYINTPLFSVTFPIFSLCRIISEINFPGIIRFIFILWENPWLFSHEVSFRFSLPALRPFLGSTEDQVTRVHTDVWRTQTQDWDGECSMYRKIFRNWRDTVLKGGHFNHNFTYNTSNILIYVYLSNLVVYRGSF